MKVDLYRARAEEYVAPTSPVLVKVGPARYLSIEGRGRPGGEEFQAKLQGLYSIAWTTKMALKSKGKDFRVMGLEGVWGGRALPGPDGPDLSGAHWKLLIRVPEFVSQSAVRESVGALQRRGRFTPAAAQVRLTRWTEGRCVQMLHLGPYDAEGPDFGRMAGFARAHGLVMPGAHHEIYLSDPRRVPATRLRTILRVPVRNGPRTRARRSATKKGAAA